MLKRFFLPYLCLWWWWWWWLEPRSAAEPGMLPQVHQSMTVSRKPAFMFPAVSGYTSNGLEALSGDRLSHSFDNDSIRSQVEFQRTLRVRGSPWESRHTQKRNISTLLISCRPLACVTEGLSQCVSHGESLNICLSAPQVCSSSIWAMTHLSAWDIHHQLCTVPVFVSTLCFLDKCTNCSDFFRGDLHLGDIGGLSGGWGSVLLHGVQPVRLCQQHSSAHSHSRCVKMQHVSKNIQNVKTALTFTCISREC